MDIFLDGFQILLSVQGGCKEVPMLSNAGDDALEVTAQGAEHLVTNGPSNWKEQICQNIQVVLDKNQNRIIRTSIECSSVS